jgi:SAM-dependent methyltransferase
VLDIGAGRADRYPGALRLDIARGTDPHLVVDLERGGLPFRDSAFATVAAHDVVEHVADLVALVAEVHRVLRPGGLFLVSTPHFSSANAWTDPTHRRALGARSFDYFGEDHELAYYSRARFRVRRRQIVFHGGPLDRVASLLARRWPDWYERRLAWIVPAWFLYFELEAVK